MILILGNFAGVFSNLCKFLTWSIASNEEDTLLFYYTNKREGNNSIKVFPFQDYQSDLKRILFYSIFEYPEGCSLETFMKAQRFEMAYPTIPTESLPSCLQGFENGFIFCTPKVYFDPVFPEIRRLYHTHIQKRLRFTPEMKAYLDPELSILKNIQAEGKRVLAVFLRSTCHYDGYNLEAVFQEIQEKLKDYDYVLPITQIRPFFEKAVQRFGSKCICLRRNYIANDVDWVTQIVSDEQFVLDVRDTVADVYLASQCDFVMGGASNMFMGALFFNPDIPYKVFQELETKNGG